MILWTVAHQTPLSMVFSRQKHWSGLSFPALRDLPESGIKPSSPALAGGFFSTEPPGSPPVEKGEQNKHNFCPQWDKGGVHNYPSVNYHNSMGISYDLEGYRGSCIALSKHQTWGNKDNQGRLLGGGVTKCG